MFKEISHLFKSITIFEIVLSCVLSVTIGISFWGWTYVYEICKPLLHTLGLKYLVSGFWIFSSVFIPYIIRRPGIALLSSLVAAFVEGLLAQWGIMSLAWGFVQGVGAEIVFFIYLYRKWDYKVLILAAISASICSFFLDYFYYSYHLLSLNFNLLQLASYIISSLFFAAYLSYWTAQRLIKTGLLNNYLIVKSRV